MSKHLKLTVKTSLLLVLSVSASVSHAFIDERTPPMQTQQATFSQPTLSVSAPVAPAPSVQQPTSMATVTPAPAPKATVTTSSDTAKAASSKATMSDPHNINQDRIPLADALISLYFPVVNEAVELDAVSALLDQKVSIQKGTSRTQAVNSIESQLGVEVSLNGSTVTVKDQRGPVATASYDEVAVTEIIAHEHQEPASYGEPIGASAWSLRSGEMLSDELKTYTQDNDIKLIWDAQVDYKISVPFAMNKGTPLANIQAVLALYDKSSMPLQHVWYNKQNLILIKDSPVY